MENENGLREQAIKTVVFYDLFDYPLTAFEVWEYSDRKTRLGEISVCLDDEAGRQNGTIAMKDGFYFLRGRENTVAIRSERYNHSQRKLKIAREFIRPFRHLPFIKVIALANSIGAHNLRDGSDIDIFVISAPGRLWLTRLAMAGVAKVFGRRPTVRNKRDKICLSFYVAADSLDLSGLELSGGDPYFYHWLRNLVLLYNKDKTYEKFLSANNIKPWLSSDIGPIPDEPERPARFSCFAGFFECLAKKIQLKIMSPALKRAMEGSPGVVVNDKVLKLYLHDNRREYAEKYGNKIRQIFTESN